MVSLTRNQIKLACLISIIACIIFLVLVCHYEYQNKPHLEMIFLFCVIISIFLSVVFCGILFNSKSEVEIVEDEEEDQDYEQQEEENL
jgi:hypothetical protein